jgi:hypothetical protein
MHLSRQGPDPAVGQISLVDLALIFRKKLRRRLSWMSRRRRKMSYVGNVIRRRSTRTKSNRSLTATMLALMETLRMTV